MKIIKEENKLVIKSWAEDIDDNVKKQALNLADLPFAFHHIALMADGHLGYGMPIGGVLATKDVVIPNAVGSDISCGVVICKLPINEISQEQIKQIFGGSEKYKGGIRSYVPIKTVQQSRTAKFNDMCFLPNKAKLATHFRNRKEESIVYQNWNKHCKQLGTLGQGNHFIEIQKGDDGYIYLMIHSGSRNLGYQVNKHYDTIAKELNAQWFSAVDRKSDLAFLPVSSKEGQDYIEEMNYCVQYAKQNRALMLHKSLFVIQSVLNLELSPFYIGENSYDIEHNYVALEHHFGENVYVHRKGAIKVQKGRRGLIPGSQGSSSFIVKGKGSTDSFYSCSHGAGRLMSRTKAIKSLNMEQEQQKLVDKGVVHSVRSKHQLDEAPGAYKNIHTVIENQKDLVDVLVELTPLGVIKG